MNTLLSSLQQEALSTGKFEKLAEYCASDEYRQMSYVDRNEGFLTSHKLKEFQRCAFCYDLKYNQKIPSPVEDTEALIIGQAFDDMITLGEKEFKDKYVAVARRLKESDKIQITKGMATTLNRLQKEFSSNPLFAKSYEKQVMFTKIDGINMLLKIELDGVDESIKAIRDLKTCANITRFDPRDYDFQACFYHFVMEEITQEKYDVILDVTDKHENFSRSACFIYNRFILGMQRGEILQTLSKMQEAHELEWFEPATNQDILWNCPFYGYEGHGRPTKPFYF